MLHAPLPRNDGTESLSCECLKPSSTTGGTPRYHSLGPKDKFTQALIVFVNLVNEAVMSNTNTTRLCSRCWVQSSPFSRQKKGFGQNVIHPPYRSERRLEQAIPRVEDR